MLTVDEARSIAAKWRPQFADEANFEQSWSRFFSMVGDPDPHKLDLWLAKDQAKDAVINAGIVKEPTLPLPQQLSPKVLAQIEAHVEPRHDCWKCGKFEDEPAGERCSNPRWHWPNAKMPAQTAVPGWKRLAS